MTCARPFFTGVCEAGKYEVITPSAVPDTHLKGGLRTSGRASVTGKRPKVDPSSQEGGVGDAFDVRVGRVMYSGG